MPESTEKPTLNFFHVTMRIKLTDGEAKNGGDPCPGENLGPGRMGGQVGRWLACWKEAWQVVVVWMMVSLVSFEKGVASDGWNGRDGQEKAFCKHG
jgi:hypothetical protein